MAVDYVFYTSISLDASSLVNLMNQLVYHVNPMKWISGRKKDLSFVCFCFNVD